jgi:hypothetical protein
MNEQPMQAYVGLIQQLLNCPQGQEGEVLQAKAELVDAGLVKVMQQYAVYLESQGNNNASWLRGFAGQLAQALELETASLAKSELENVAKFLFETLRLVAENDGNPQQIYPIWSQQQAQFNQELLEILPTGAEQLFARSLEQRSFVARTLGNLGM